MVSRNIQRLMGYCLEYLGYSEIVHYCVYLIDIEPCYVLIVFLLLSSDLLLTNRPKTSHKVNLRCQRHVWV